MEKIFICGIFLSLAFCVFAGTNPSNTDEAPCDTMKCKEHETCTHVTPMCARGAPKCERKGICMPSKYAPDDTNDSLYPYRVARAVAAAADTKDFDPCATMECAAGKQCKSVQPFCPEDSVCKPKGVCVTKPQ